VGGQRSAYTIVCVQTPDHKPACGEHQLSANTVPGNTVYSVREVPKNTVPGKCNSRPVRELSGPAPPWKYKTPACGGAPSGVGTYTRTGTSPAGPANVVSLTSLTGGAAGRCPLPPAALFSTKQAAAGWTEPGAAAQTAFSRALLGGA